MYLQVIELTCPCRRHPISPSGLRTMNKVLHSLHCVKLAVRTVVSCLTWQVKKKKVSAAVYQLKHAVLRHEDTPTY